MTDDPNVAATAEAPREIIEDSGDAQSSDVRVTYGSQRLDKIGHAKQPPIPKPSPEQRLDKRLNRRRQRLAVDVAMIAMGGATGKEIAAKLGIAQITVLRLMKHPDYPKAIERARANLRRQSENAAEAGRSEALEVCRAIQKRFQQGDEDVNASDAMKAASAILAASAPPSSAMFERAKRELLKSLPAHVRRQVTDSLQGSQSDYLANLSDDDLDALLGDDE